MPCRNHCRTRHKQASVNPPKEQLGARNRRWATLGIGRHATAAFAGFQGLAVLRPVSPLHIDITMQNKCRARTPWLAAAGRRRAETGMQFASQLTKRCGRRPKHRPPRGSRQELSHAPKKDRTKVLVPQSKDRLDVSAGKPVYQG